MLFSPGQTFDGLLYGDGKSGPALPSELARNGGGEAPTLALIPQIYNKVMLTPIARTKLTAICFVIALLLPTVSFAEINVENVQKSVVFLYAADASGKIVPAGTGFIVDVPITSQPGQVYKLLVTARHMVDPEWSGCPVPPKLFLHVNEKNFDPKKQEVGTVDLDLTGEVNAGKQWFVNPDNEVDAAVAALNGKMLDEYDTGAVPIFLFPTDEELKTFKAGDEVVSAGLLAGASGKKRNYPISKYGRVSSVPEESIDAPKCGQRPSSHSLKLWFIAASLVEGNSGSPIYFSPPLLSNRRPVLLGVQSMSFIPWDVAGMTPVRYVYEIIESLKLKDANLTRHAETKP